MTNKSWVDLEIDKLVKNETDFINRAMLLEARNVLRKQEHQIDLMQGELDGRIWNPSKW